ncbi:glycosyltransferase family 39 protein [Natrinema salinisoli]|uniref:glycosyltransferase family 39 protein n=1 Tax=Natrinema salinisoli TaxID=2878535 RepID=UPI001CF00C9C|nr:glycosyltransferase family 39 protein [Natrinema salinisoli]
MGLEYQSVGRTVAHYLLAVTVGGLAFAAVGDSTPPVPLGWMTLAVCGAFIVVTVMRHYGSAAEPTSVAITRSARPPRSPGIVVGLLGLLLVGGVLRGYALGVQSFWFDEAISANAAIAILETGQPTFPSGYTYWRALPHTLMVAASMALLGSGEAAARLPSVVAGVITIAATYWLGKKTGGARVGLLAATLLTFATWELAWSRQARMYQLFQLLYTLSIVLLLDVGRTWFDDVRTGVTLAGVSAGAMLTHRIGYVLPPITVVYLAIRGSLDRQFTRRTAGGFLMGTLVLLVVVELVFGAFVSSTATIATIDGNYALAYAEWLAANLQGIFYLGLLGTALTFYRGWYRAGTVLVLAVGPPLWVLSFHTELYATRYLYFGVPIWFVWAAVTVEYVATLVLEGIAVVDRRVRPSSGCGHRITSGQSRGEVTLVVALGLLTVLASGGGVTVMPQATYDLGPNAPQPEFAEAYGYVNEHHTPSDVIAAGWTAPGLYYSGGVDYWLAHDLLGNGNRWTVNGEERYAGAEPVTSADDLQTVMENHERGWIIIDEIAFARLSPDTQAMIQNLPQKHSGSVDVYQWNFSESRERDDTAPFTVRS